MVVRKAVKSRKKTSGLRFLKPFAEQQIDFCPANDENGPVDEVSDDNAASKPAYNEHMFTFEKFEGVSMGVCSTQDHVSSTLGYSVSPKRISREHVSHISDVGENSTLPIK